METNKWCRIKDNKGIFTYNLSRAIYVSPPLEVQWVGVGTTFQIVIESDSKKEHCLVFDDEKTAHRVYDAIIKKLGIWGTEIIE